MRAAYALRWRTLAGTSEQLDAQIDGRTDMTDDTTNPDVRILRDGELDQVNGGAVLEVGIGPVTIQINPDSGCFAIWYGKEFVGGACKK
jgi:hypothetical protein